MRGTDAGSISEGIDHPVKAYLLALYMDPVSVGFAVSLNTIPG